MLRVMENFDKIRIYGGELSPAQGGAVPFAFLVHPLDRQDVAILDPRAAPWLTKGGGLIDRVMRDLFKELRLKIVGKIEVTAGDRKAHGIFIFIPYLPKDFQDPSKKEEILATILEASQVAAAAGARYLGLGAFTSIITKNGQWLANHPGNPLPVTSGSAGTAVGVERGVLTAMQCLGMANPAAARLALVGATGAVGRPTGLLLASQFGEVVLVARNEQRLENLRRLLEDTVRRLDVSTDLNCAIRQADVVVLATNAADASALALDPARFKPGALVVDVARPHNVTEAIVKARSDVLFVEGAIFEYPGATDFHELLQMGGPSCAYGCLSETMAWALAGESDSKSVGVFLDPDTVQRVGELFKLYGFRLAGFRMFDRPLEAECFERVRSARETN